MKFSGQSELKIILPFTFTSQSQTITAREIIFWAFFPGGIWSVCQFTKTTLNNKNFTSIPLWRVLYGYQLCPLLADLFLYSYGSDFLNNMIWSGHRKLARSLGLFFRYIDDLIVFNNKKYWEYVKDIYPSQLNVEKTNQSDNLASYLDLTFTIEKDGKLSTKLYITNVITLIFTLSIFHSCQVTDTIWSFYGVYIWQLIPYARCCSYYGDFRHHHRMLVERLVYQRCRYERLRNSFKKFYGRYQDLILKYQRSV